MRRPRWKRGKDRATPLVPAVKVRLGDKVWHWHAFWLQGVPYGHWERCLVIGLSKDGLVSVQTNYGYCRKVGLAALFIEKP